jgi:predicted dehydrogenase
MFAAEAARAPHERVDFIAVVTPNFLHFPVASTALRYGFPVLCDKPMTFDLAEAVRLAAQVKESGLLFGLTHNYTGYPLVKEARARIAAGALGALRKVVVAYPQGWLATRIEADGQKQAGWRTDPKRAGASGCMGDIGTHAANLAEYITGLRIAEVCADLHTFVPGRLLDDDGSVLLRFAGGARGVLHASQIASGEENSLSIQVYGEKGSLSWRQEEPNTLTLLWPDRARELVRSGVGPLSSAATRHTRLPAGHPEGFLEAFANIYRNFAAALRARKEGKMPDPELDFPGVEEGVRGMAFIEAVVASSRSEKKWHPVADPLN